MLMELLLVPLIYLIGLIVIDYTITRYTDKDSFIYVTFYTLGFVFSISLSPLIW